jgi:hypothetical protein
VSDLENAPSIESKTSTWVAGESRSLQFYALRHGLSWVFAEKTRNLVDAMKAAWGSELDVVTMLAIRPSPVNRDWARFDEEYEIVDLGRNHKKARKTFNLLSSQARQENALQNRATPAVHDTIAKWVKDQKRYRKHARAQWATQVTDGGIKSMFDREFEENLAHEVAVPVGKKLLRYLEDASHPVIAIKRAIADIREDSGNYNPLCSYTDFNHKLLNLMRQSQRSDLLGTLNGFLDKAEIEKRAQDEIKNRRATVDKAINQLSKLGLSTGDL